MPKVEHQAMAPAGRPPLLLPLLLLLLSRLGAVALAAAAGADFSSLPLNEAPFLMTHDAASGYLGHGPVDAWTRTQTGGFGEQLECGARALDARPKLDAALGLVWHHGGVTIPVPFDQAVAEAVAWCGAHPDELVLLPVWDCVGEDGCMAAAVEALAGLGVPMVSNCSDLEHMTVAQAADRAELPNGGRLLALVGPNQPDGVACSFGNYDVSVTCSGLVEAGRASGQGGLPEAVSRCLARAGVDSPDLPVSRLMPEQVRRLVACGEDLRAGDLAWMHNRTAYRCYQGDPLREIPFAAMFAYLDAVDSQGPPADGLLFQNQALWQETALTILLGSLELSSLIRDERRSELNAALVDALRAGRWSHVNFFEVNNVCHHGPALHQALRELSQQISQQQKTAQHRRVKD